MGNRFLTLAPGVLLGVAASLAAVKVAAAWRWWPDRDLARASAYVREVMELVNAQYVDATAVSYAGLARGALRGMLEALDPHSEFLEKASHDQVEEDLSGEFGGIGVQVETRQNRVVVIAPMAGTPGERAGIRRGDEIVAIDGQPVATGGVDAVVSRLRGRPRTTVIVGIQRPGVRESLTLTLTRELIRIESVRGTRVLADGVGYVQLTEFSEHTGRQLRLALARLAEQGIRALVLDLRNNPGGLLEAAVEVAQVFFREGELIVETRGRRPQDNERFRAAGGGAPWSLPIAVLVNAGSASAAEIVAGALKDAGRAVVVGERTFGKGSVQSIFKLRDGEGLRLTTARYFTPAGTSIHEQGVRPHVEVVMTPEEDSRLAQQRSRPDLGTAEFEARFGFAPVADRQLETALAMLRGLRLLDGNGGTRG
ncbi:MAG: S41 family peptidase [Verrucomicrobia bacterium]|nr:S41 family peptidase [Verrucomicrobiota bacterium]